MGVDVCEIGLGPTPLLYYSCYENKAAGGVMVTGSHNPKDHNGFKFVLNNMPFYGEDLILLSKKAMDFFFKSQKGKLTYKNFKKTYLDRIFKGINLKKKFKIVWDSGNGSAGELMSKIAKKINSDNELLYETIDGNFPNHHPDPSNPKNLKECIQLIKKKQMDFGIAFDGDGDRIGVIDDKGRVLSGDQLLLLFAKEILKKKRGAKIIGDVKCSFNLDYYGFDDALYSSIKLVELLDNSKKKLSEIIDDLPKSFNTPEIRIKCSDLKKFDIIEQVISNQKNKNVNIIDIDGLRVLNETGWWLLRASNTEAELVLRCEANSQDNLRKQLLLVKKELQEVDQIISDKILVEKFT